MTQDQRDALRRSIMTHEGFRSSAYQDSLGFWTIGYGRLIDGRRGGGISREEALLLLENDLSTAIRSCVNAFPWFVELDPVRQRVVAEMAFNMGLPTLRTFKQTLAAIESGNYAGAARGMLASKWRAQVGERAVRLAKLMETGAE